MAAPAYASSAATGVAAGTADVVVTKPSGTASGNRLVAFCWCTSASIAWTLPSGWTEEARDDANSTALFSRVADGSEGATLTFSRGSTTGNAGVSVQRVTGAGTIQAASLTSSSGVTTVALSSVTATQTDTLLSQMVGRGTTGATTWTPPASATERDDNAPSGTALRYAIGDEVVSAGATGTRTWTLNAATGVKRGALMAINPASAPAPTASGSITGSTALTGTARAVRKASGSITGSTALAGAGRRTAKAVGSITGGTALTGTGSRPQRANGSLTGSTALSGAATSALRATGTLTGSTLLTGAGRRIARALGSITGSTILTGVGNDYGIDVTPAQRIVTTPTETRVAVTQAETRSTTTPAENRTSA